eukprot:374233_1
MPLKGTEPTNVNDNRKSSSETTSLIRISTTNKPKTPSNNDISDAYATTSIPVAILNLVKSLLGAAMLSLPWAFSKSTFIPGCIGLFISVIYSFITCMFIITACDATNTFEYSALLRNVHPYWETAATITIIYVAYSSCLSYVIVTGDFFTDGIHGLNNNWAFKHDREIYIAVITCCMLLPLSLLKEFKSLKASSIIGNASNLYCVFLAIGFTISYSQTTDAHTGEGFQWNDWNMNILIVTNVCAKAYASQYPLPPMYQQLKNKSLNKIRFVTICAFTIVTIIYLSFAICGYYLFGIQTQGDVLLNYPSDNIYFIIARFAMGFSIIGCYPLIFKSFMQCVEDKFFNPKKGSKYDFETYPKIRAMVITICILSMMVIGLLVDNVGPVSSIEGAITVLALMALFPVLVAWKIGDGKHLSSQQMRRYMSTNNVNVEMVNVVDDNKAQHNEKKLQVRTGYIVYLGFMLFIGLFLGIAGIILQFVLLG